MSVRQSPVPRRIPSERRATSARVSLTSATSSSTGGSISSKTVPTALNAIACERPMKPVPMSPILSAVIVSPVSLHGDRQPAVVRALRSVGDRKSPKAVAAGRELHGLARERLEKVRKLQPVSFGVALEKERQRGLAREAGAIRALDARRRRILRPQHAELAKGLDPLVVAEAAATAVRDLADPAAGGRQKHSRSIDVAGRLEARIHEAGAARIYLHRLLAHHPARHVEVVDHHVAEQATRATHVLERRRRRIAARYRQCRERADPARGDLTPDACEAGIVAPVETEMQEDARLLRHGQAARRALEVEIERLLAEDRLARAGAGLDQVCVRVGR